MKREFFVSVGGYHMEVRAKNLQDAEKQAYIALEGKVAWWNATQQTHPDCVDDAPVYDWYEDYRGETGYMG